MPLHDPLHEEPLETIGSVYHYLVPEQTAQVSSLSGHLKTHGCSAEHDLVIRMEIHHLNNALKDDEARQPYAR